MQSITGHRNKQKRETRLTGGQTGPALRTQRGPGSSFQLRHPGKFMSYLLAQIFHLSMHLGPSQGLTDLRLFFSPSLLCLGMGGEGILWETRTPFTLFSRHFGWADWTVSSHPHPLGRVQKCVAIPRFLCSSDF